MTFKEFVNLANKISKQEIEDKKTKNILDAELMIDTLEGDIFTITSIDYSQKNNVVKLKLHKGDKTWIKIGIKHPVKITK